MINGVIDYDVQFESDYVELRYDENQVSIEEIEEALAEIGYRPASHRPVSDE